MEMHGGSVTFRLASSQSDKQGDRQTVSRSVGRSVRLLGRRAACLAVPRAAAVSALMCNSRARGASSACKMPRLCVASAHTASGNKVQDIYAVKSVFGQ